MISNVVPPWRAIRLVGGISSVFAFIDIAKNPNNIESLDINDDDPLIEIMRRAGLSISPPGQIETWADYRRFLTAGLELALERLKS